MKVDFQRKVDQLIGPAICRMLSALSWFRRDPPASATPQRILVILLSEMGSLVLARPMFACLKEKYPEASFHALLFRQNKEILDILDVLPEENILTVRNTSPLALLMDSLTALRKTRKLGIDTAIDCELFSRVSSIYSFLSGARIRVGFHPHTQEGLYRGNFINRPVLYNPYQHISHQFITLAEAINAQGAPKVKRAIHAARPSIPFLEVSKDEIEAFEERLKADFPQVGSRGMVLVYAGGGLLPIRAWPLSHFCKVASDLVRSGYVVGVIGLEQEKETAHGIQARCNSNDCIDLTGYTKTLRELMLLFHLASLLITNDGGPGHFATMTPIRSIILYGPETPVLYGSLDDKSVNLYSHLSCSPCLTAYNHRNSPCDGHNVCLKSIEPEMVLERAYEMLSQSKGVAV
jgi:ADP-heptose:LPS heptosyltransferase